MHPSDKQFLCRAIRLAMSGRGNVEPNPMVGCVLVKDGRIIGEGFHARYGGPHAEPLALAACSENPRGSTAYVTLEPCCHLDKQTPPCAPRLIEAGIARVVIGCRDPNPQVNGRGVGMLREAGVQVDGPELESDCKQLIAPFIARTVFHRPYVTLKWAQTADGKIAGTGGQRMQISNQRSMQAVHRLRARSDAILVGVNTVISDDPLLTARGVEHHRPLIRCVLDRWLRTPLQSRLVQTANQTPVIIGCGPDLLQSPAAHALRRAKAQLIPVEKIANMLRHLHALRVSNLLVEPGPTLANAFFAEGLADCLWIFRSPRTTGDAAAPDAAPLPPSFREVKTVNLNSDRLSEYLGTEGPLFFAAVPSADLQLEIDQVEADQRIKQ
jgi:diaminohydroxyphosphoribosylaminopyrimidine deaminase/5-amino-6-(5-phosphoribosylamino)uracil reductase